MDHDVNCAQWGTSSHHVEPCTALHDLVAASLPAKLSAPEHACRLPKLSVDHSAPAGGGHPLPAQLQGLPGHVNRHTMQLRLISAACAQHQPLACTPTWMLS